MRICLMLLTLSLLVIFFSTTHAVTVYVPDDFPTIQAGINACTDGDTVIVRDGTYTGPGNRDIDFTGKAIVLMSENGPEVTIIDCGGSPSELHRGFYIHYGEHQNTIVQGFTITNGYADSGGGIYCRNSSPTITGNIITNNSTLSHNSYGGGIYCYDCCYLVITDNVISGNYGWLGGGMYSSSSSPYLTGCTFKSNEAQFGGGMYNYYSSYTITDCILDGNSAVANGGGIHDEVGGDPVVDNCIFIRNSANTGGGTYHYRSDPHVTDCTFIENSATWGAGMTISNSNDAMISNCTFSENLAAPGGAGGIYNSTSNLTFTNCMFSGNRGKIGGGIFNYSSAPAITNCTFTGNVAESSGGGMYNMFLSNLSVTNCILWADLPDEISNDDSYPVIIFSNVEGGYPGEGNIDADPLFVTFHGFDYLLGRGSPCIDAGDPNIDDGREWPVWYNNGLRSDMGAYGGPGNVGWLRSGG